jgi:hypothetical protein
MSSHIIFIECQRCGVTDQLYTGNSDLENFQNNSFEGEFLKAICDECEGTDDD